jgi:F1F0 ATPase subunit 2
MTSNPLECLAALLAGILAGSVFFGGLWWTVKRLATAKHPALLMVGGAVLRTGLVLGVFLLAGRDHLDRMLAALVGFVIARIVIVRLTRPKPSTEDRPCA